MKIKKIAIYAASILAIFVYLTVGYSSHKNTKINLDYMKKTTGKIDFYGTKYKQTRYGKLKILIVLLNNSEHAFEIYRQNGEYSDIGRNIHLGEIVTIYYKPAKNSNIEIIQMEKRGQIIIDKSEFEQKERYVVHICITAALLTLLVVGIGIKKKLI